MPLFGAEPDASPDAKWLPAPDDDDDADRCGGGPAADTSHETVVVWGG
jgi:hypothetical protein